LLALSVDLFLNFFHRLIGVAFRLP